MWVKRTPKKRMNAGVDYFGKKFAQAFGLVACLAILKQLLGVESSTRPHTGSPHLPDLPEFLMLVAFAVGVSLVYALFMWWNHKPEKPDWMCTSCEQMKRPDGNPR